MKATWALFVFLVAATTVWAAKYGGCWMPTRNIGLSSSMAGERFAPSTVQTDASILLSQNFHTFINNVDPADSLFSRGLDSLGSYSPDSAGSDTTCLALDGYVGATLATVWFFTEMEVDTVFAVVEQAFYYDTTLADSGFDFGFFRTDTLFKARMTSDFDSMYVPTTTTPGIPARIYTDTFVLDAPFLRFKLYNRATIDTTSGIHIELYVRHTDQVMAGAGARLQHQLESKVKLPGSTYRTDR